MMIGYGKVHNFLLKKLVFWFSISLSFFIHTFCGNFPADNQLLFHFMHISDICCKINNFISFSHQKSLKK